ncbi:hypothetical protein V8C86DRAFT_2461040 [Haematococcus lacustris]
MALCASSRHPLVRGFTAGWRAAHGSVTHKHAITVSWTLAREHQHACSRQWPASHHLSRPQHMPRFLVSRLWAAKDETGPSPSAGPIEPLQAVQSDIQAPEPSPPYPPDAPEQSCPMTAAASPWVLLAGVAGLSATALDLFHPSSPHLLLGVDQQCHQFAQGLGPVSRLFFADIVMSDVPIVLGLLGWTICSATSLLQGTQPIRLSILLAWTAYAWGAGPLQYDPFMVDLIKQVFQRTRPSPIHDSFSFPSGHTSSATFLAGALLFVLLPVVQRTWQPTATAAVQVAAQLEAGAQPASRGSMKVLPDTVQRLRKLAVQMQGSWGLWAAASCTTAAGRVMADAHWFSDTLGASFLGITLVSLLANAVRLIYKANR